MGESDNNIRVGVAYYPEHWDESRWETDVDLMVDAGISVVRLAEFAWSRLEPSPGNFQFAWLERAIALFECAGIKIVLGTPTAAPPAWLHERYPDVYPADKRGYRLGFGTRLQRCLNHPAMRERSRAIVDAMAKHFAVSRAVIGWQTDNEFTGNLCYCPICHQSFHVWLKNKYESLDALNAAWGTVFWSHEYSAWEQIPLPWEAKCGDVHNPSLQLDYRRFQSDATLAFQQEQIDILRAQCPGHFITHNFMGTHASMDYVALAKPLDFVSWDNYPNTPWHVSETGASLSADVMRGLKQANVWVMEQQNGITGWDKMGRRPTDAQLRCWAWQAIAHGADTVMFFRWRSCRFGAEQFWHGMLNHDGKPRRRYRSVVRFTRELAQLAPVLNDTTLRSEVAILNSYDQHYALQIQPQAEGLAYWEQAGRYYHALRRQGINVDIVPLDADLARYRVVILPSWYLLTNSDAATLEHYVRRGGRLIVSPRTGVKNENNVCLDAPILGPLAKILGVEVDEYDALGAATCRISLDDRTTYEASVWADALLLDGADARAHYADGQFKGEAAVTKHACGLGEAWYFGTYGEPAFYDRMLTEILDAADVVREVVPPEGVEVCWREKSDARVLFVLNVTGAPKEVNLPATVTALLGNAPAAGRVTLGPFEVGIYSAARVRSELGIDMNTVPDSAGAVLQPK